MHSIVARLRGRAISQSTTTSAQSDEAIPSTPDTPTSPLMSALPLPGEPPSVVGRKILPHVHELMDSFPAKSDPMAGLSPPPSGSRSVANFKGQKPNSPAVSLGQDSRSGSPAGHSARSSLRMSQDSLSRFSQKISSVSGWSTFGRNKQPGTVHPGQSHLPSSTRQLHTGSVDTFTTRHTSAQGDSGNVPETVSFLSQQDHSPRSSSVAVTPRRRSFSSELNHDVPTNERPSPAHTTSSRQHSTYRSMTIGSSSYSTQSQSISLPSVHTPLEQIFDISSLSPRTFGHPTPPDGSAISSTLLTPPPLPPLVHPELIASLATRQQPMVQDISNTSVTPPRRRHSSLNSKTYPPHRRCKREYSGQDENMPFPSHESLPSGRTLRAYASTPGVRSIFRAAQHSRLTRNSSVKSVRRSSAEWSARQATVGVTAECVSEYGWPAEVSKEILKLTLSDDGGERRTNKAVTANAEIKQRGKNVVALSSQATRPCSPPLRSHSPLDFPEDKTDGGDKQSRSSRNSVNPAPIRRRSEGEDETKMLVPDGGSSTLKWAGKDSYQPATLPRASVTRAYRKSILLPSSSIAQGPEAGPSSLQQPSPPNTPPRKRSSFRQPGRSSSEPALSQVPETPLNNAKGKRKLEEIDITPPDQRNANHATFVIPTGHRRALHQSEPSRAPSSYQRKRVRLTSSSPTPSVNHSRPGSANNTADVASTSRPYPSPSPAVRALSRAASTRSNQHSTHSATPDTRRDGHRSMSEISIPISALVAPHPPSVARSNTYHMRDPRRPPPITPTSWALHLRSEYQESSPFHAWCFFVGFLLFPLWWIVSFMSIPQTRSLGATDTEKGVTLDDPQVEHDARSWRFRCRIMSAVSIVTYVPFIILIAIFAPR